jgi:hypothetical protein
MIPEPSVRLRYAVEKGRPYAHPAFSQRSDEALRRRLVQENRELADPRVDDWRKVNWLCDWVYRHVPDASFSRCLDAGDRSVYGADVSDILRRVALEKRGFKCAGAALILSKLCGMFDYSACVYNAGDSAGSRASHAVTLVEVTCSGESRWVVLDPYFNHSLEDSEGQPIDFRTVISLLAQRRAAEIRTATRQRRKRWMVMTCADGQKIRRLRAVGARLIRSTGGVMFCTHASSMNRWMRDHPEASAWIAGRVLENNPLYLLAFPLNIHGDEKFSELGEWVKAKWKDHERSVRLG